MTDADVVLAQGETPEEPLRMDLTVDGDRVSLSDVERVTLLIKTYHGTAAELDCRVRANGSVIHEWDDGETDLETGQYGLVARVEYRDGRTRIFPNERDKRPTLTITEI